MEPRNSSDSLLARARKGDRPSFDLLVQATQNDLDRHVRLRLGTHLREYVDVADVLQEVYSRAFRSIRTFQDRGERALLSWLRRISENAILELARKQRREPAIFLEHERAGSEVSPSKHMRREERFERLEDALNSLPPDYREAVILSRIDGLKIKEIAKRMERSPKAVSHLLSRAMIRLKERFGDTRSFSLPARRLELRGPRDGHDG